MKKSRTSLSVVLFAVLVTAAFLAVSGCQREGKSFQLLTKETRPVLDPMMFQGQTRAAYAAAKKYPELMNEVFCYCYCDQAPFHHNTLLSCFTDKHGAG